MLLSPNPLNPYSYCFLVRNTGGYKICFNQLVVYNSNRELTIIILLVSSLFTLNLPVDLLNILNTLKIHIADPA